MIAHLKALQAMLGPLGYAGFRWRATGDLPQQYYVLWTPPYGPDIEAGLCGTSGVMSVDVRATWVAASTDGASIMADRGRGILSPGGAEVPVLVAGFAASVRFLRSETINVDTSVTITGLNTHPAYAVDSYRLTSQEA